MTKKVQMANKYMEKFSGSVVFWEMHRKIFSTTRLAKILNIADFY